MSTRADRARRRRAEWSGQVVQMGQPKGSLYASLQPAQRLAAFVELNERAWRAAGLLPLKPLPRDAWPGEVFEIRRRG